MNQKNKIIFLSTLIVGLLTLSLGITFSIFNFTKTGTNSKLVVGDIYMHYNETNQITIDNAMPNNPYIVNSIMSTQEYTEGGSNELSKCVDILLASLPDTDSTSAESICKDDVQLQQAYDEGMLDYFNLTNKFIENNILILNSSMPYLEFTIDGKNTTTDKDIWYEIVLTHGDNHETRTTRIRDDLLKFQLIEIKDDVETFVVNNKSYSDLNNHRMWVDTIDKNTTSEVVHTYRLYMWVSNDTKIGNVDQDYTMEEWNDVYASIKVNVTGDFNEKELAYEDLYDVTDESCFLVGTINNGNEVAIVDYNPRCGIVVTIPKTIQGYPVTVIGNSKTSIITQLNNNTNNAIINDLNNYNNEKITMNKIDLDADGAFYGKHLISVVIPDSVTTIESYAFYRNELTSLIIPDSVTTIGEYAFNDNLLPDNQAFIYARTDNNSDRIAEIDNTTVVSYGGKNKQPIIPDSVTTIGNRAFWNNQLTSVTIGNSVTTIGDGAFRNNQLTSATIGNSVTSIGKEAFYDNQLTSVTIPDSVTTIGNSAFASNQLTSVTIPNSVTSIGEQAFRDNQLTSITIGSGIQYIGWIAFLKYSSSNPNLSIITINKNCSDIKNIPASSSDSTLYYPWLSWSSPYTESGVTIYGSNSEVCDSY